MKKITRRNFIKGIAGGAILGTLSAYFGLSLFKKSTGKHNYLILINPYNTNLLLQYTRTEYDKPLHKGDSISLEGKLKADKSNDTVGGIVDYVGKMHPLRETVAIISVTKAAYDKLDLSPASMLPLQ